MCRGPRLHCPLKVDTCHCWPSSSPPPSFLRFSNLSLCSSECRRESNTKYSRSRCSFPYLFRLRIVSYAPRFLSLDQLNAVPSKERIMNYSWKLHTLFREGFESHAWKHLNPYLKGKNRPLFRNFEFSIQKYYNSSLCFFQLRKELNQSSGGANNS